MEVAGSPVSDAATDGVSKTKLMVNYIPERMDRDSMYSLFSSAGKISSCRLIANRGYGFVEYVTPEDAERAKANFDGLGLQGKTLKVSFALLNPETKQKPGTDADRNLYVSNLQSDMTLDALNGLFRSYGQITNSRVSQGVGFVCFETRKQAEDAIGALNGVSPSPGAPPISVKFALKGGRQNNQNRQPHMGQVPAHARNGPPIALAPLAIPYNGDIRYGAFPQPQPAALLPQPGKALAFLNKGHQRFNPMAPAGAPVPPVPVPVAPEAPQRNTVYVYNVGDDTDELTLWQLFGPYGAIESIKVIKDPETKKNRGFAFVNMRDRDEAAHAIRSLNGHTVNGQVLSVNFKTQKAK